MIDGLLLYHLQKELDETLSKARLEKIVQHDEHLFGLTFYRYGDKQHLIINVHPKDFAIYLSIHKHNEILNTQFSQSLKKELSGAILDHITQYQTDRVLVLSFTSYDLIEGPIKKELVFEAMGKYSNLILTSNQMIIDTHKKMFFDTGRQLLPHATFDFFPSDKKPFTHFSYDNITIPKDISTQYMGISRLTATYLFEHHLKPLDLEVKPTVNVDKQDVYFSDIFDEQDEKITQSTISQLFDRPKKAVKQSKVSYEQFIQKQLLKYRRKDEQLKQQEEQNNERLLAKNSGDLIYQSMIPLTEKHSSISVNDQDIILDPMLTLNENAQRYYQIYQKAKRGIRPIQEQIEANQQLINLFLAYQTYLSISDGNDLKDFASDLEPFGYKIKTKTVNNKKKQQPNITKIIDQNATYILGKNDKQNAYIAHQLANQNDMWFHVKDAPGTHLVVQTNDLSEAVIRKAAMLAAYHSSLSLSSSIPVDYTQIRHLKKIPKMPGYHVTYTHQKTIYIDIDNTQIKSWLKL